MLASEVMDSSAVLLNDFSKTIFPYQFQTPYLNIALAELDEIMEANNVPTSNQVSAALVITTAMTDIGGLTGPALPTDLVEIQSLSERQTGTTDDFIQMVRFEFLPLTDVITESLIYWAWINETIQFIGATTSRDVKIDYVKRTITPITSETDTITVLNCKTFLSYRTAALCASFIGENPARSEELNVFAEGAITRFVSINTKGRQSIFTRRRPFRAGYKSVGGDW